MFAGIRGVGAPDATWQEALDLELAAAKDRKFGGAGIDLYKAFDVLDRNVVYTVMRKGGIPESVVSAYQRFFDSLKFRNKLGLGVGQPHQKYCAIAQGCALSMPLFALVLRPWIIRMRQHGVIPRTLADDVRVYGVQSGLQLENQPCTLTARLRSAVEDTFVFMDAMGASVSVSKSHIYASHGDLRKTMGAIQWGSGLAANRGGELEFTLQALASDANRLVALIGAATGHQVKYTRENPTAMRSRLLAMTILA